MNPSVVYVGILMTYDYYEFQEVIFASIDLAQVKKEITVHTGEDEVPVTLSEKESERFSWEEVAHYLIKKFPSE